MISKWTQKTLGVLALCIFLANPAYGEIIVSTDDITIETAKVSSGKWTLPYVTAHSAILMDAQTGSILYERDAHKQRPPASTTKILTAIVALELADLDEVVTVSEKADKVGESSLYLNKNDKLKLGELIEGALVKSGNDACVAIAEQTAGSLDNFIKIMNLKAVSIGAYNTNFTNPHGLPDKNHYTTAYDLAVMARYGLGIPEFSEIVQRKVATVNYEYPQKNRVINNTNKLLYNYYLADGVKTGTTNAAGKCLVASASKNGRRLICVVLNAPDRFGDAQRLLEWGFNNTEIVSLGKKGDRVTNHPSYQESLSVALGRDVVLCLESARLNEIRLQVEFLKGIYPPINKGDILGSYNIFMADKLIKEVPLVAGEDSIGNPLDFSGTLNLFINKALDIMDIKG
ncbi:MAG: D-alanyl-D-alanine carboxypeptidase [Gracilibacter sp. BRH_c7a]|nr:MAG: D-alanyl-D-alanine carboxypeptidase [Gracilibacter sp. BRH_c7a]